MTTNHPAHGPVSLDRLYQIRETLSKAAAQSDGGNLGYAMVDAVKAINELLELRKREQEPVYQVRHGDQWHDLSKAQYYDHVNLGADGLRIVYAAPQLPQKAVADDIGEIRVGRLPTMNQDEYPGLGDWWVQLRIGENADEVLARVYGATPREANNRAVALVSRSAMLQAGNSPVIPEGWVMVPKEMTPEMMRAVQIKIELGGYAASELSGAYDMFAEFWDVAVSAATQQEVK